MGDAHVLGGLLEEVPDAYLVLDQQWRVTYANKAACILLDDSEPDIQGCTIWGLLPEWQGTIFEARMQEGRDTATPLRFEGFSLKHERFFLCWVAPADGGGLAMVVSDVTGTLRAAIDAEARGQAEMEHARLAAMVDASPDAIVAETLDGTITHWNAGARSLYGYEARDVVGGATSIILPPERVGEKAQLLDQVRRGMRIENLDTTRRHRNGDLVDVSISVVPLTDSHGGVIGACTIARDIGRYKRVEGRLRRKSTELEIAEKRKDAFLALLGHELRNPLAPIDAAVELFRRDRSKLPPSLRHATDVLSRQVEQICCLVDDLMDLARISRGKLTLYKERIRARDVTLRAIEMVRPLIESRGHKLECQLSPDPLWIEGDRARLGQAIANLLTNAAKYTPSEGHISVTVEPDGDDVKVSVRDDGVGFEHEILSELFTPFAQGERRSSGGSGGLGLGLPLVKQLVELHDGSVTAESAGPGAGSTFTVRVPRLVDDALESGKVPHPVKSSSSRRILVVDDNVDSAETVALLLAQRGHHVDTAFDGRGALEKVAAHHPEVLLLDLDLGRMSGFDVAREVRDMEGGDDMLIVALTGYGQDQDRRDAVRAGFDELLVKPLDLERLSELLTTHH